MLYLLHKASLLSSASTAIYPDGHALATISMGFVKDYKKPPFSKSRQAKAIVKPSTSTLVSSETAVAFQSATPAHSSSPSTRDESTFEPQISGYNWPTNLSESDPSPSSRIYPSYPSNSSSLSLIQKNARTTPMHVPRPRSKTYLNEAPEGPTAYDQNHPPGGPSSLLTIARPRPASSNTEQDSVDYDMTPAKFGAPLARISSKLPTVSHQDRPCFVSDLPTAITSPFEPRISQPSTTCLAVSLATTGVKRRLGMGRTTGGYSNKKFKPPT
jgi:hypothetical protein